MKYYNYSYNISFIRFVIMKYFNMLSKSIDQQDDMFLIFDLGYITTVLLHPN